MAEQKQGEGRVVFSRPNSLLPVVTNYCPGCPHGIVHRLVAEVIDELDIEGRTVGVAPVGCAVTAPDFFGCDMIEAAHGRAPAVATGVKRVLPDNVVFAYQGDGDLASIGTAGVSGAGMIMLAMVLTQVGLPVEGIAIIAGVDKLFDMGRTTLNITGDATCALFISRLEREKAAKKAAKAAK